MGRPKGSKNKDTLLNAEAMRKYRDRVRKRLGRLLNAQFSLAEGLQYMIRVTKIDGKISHERVTDPDEIVKALDGGVTKEEGSNVDGDFYYITTEKPDIKALDSMLDRTFGKPQQHVDVTSGEEPISEIQVTYVRTKENETRPESNEGS